jgi:hypothetical protein
MDCISYFLLAARLSRNKGVICVLISVAGRKKGRSGTKAENRSEKNKNRKRGRKLGRT